LQLAQAIDLSRNVARVGHHGDKRDDQTEEKT
jgi:hypothetical protein